MKNKIFTAIALLVICGCTTKVSIVGTSENERVYIRGSSRGLEKEISVLREDLTYEHENDKPVIFKMKEIYLELLRRDYYACKYFYLTTGKGTFVEREEIADKLVEYGNDLEIPSAIIGVMPFEAFQGFPKHPTATYKITIVDRKNNMNEWHHYIKGVDESVIVEPWDGFSLGFLGPAYSNE